jgi:hypothetical protein
MYGISDVCWVSVGGCVGGDKRSYLLTHPHTLRSPIVGGVVAWHAFSTAATFDQETLC